MNQNHKTHKLTTAQRLLSVDNKSANRIKVAVRIKEIDHSSPLEYSIESEGKKYLSKDRAYKFLELEEFEGERSVREGWVQNLLDQWVSGRFLWHNVILASAKLGDRHFRINGQHTCWMRVSIPDSREPVDEAYVTERVYIVKNSEQLRALYATFDTNAPRSQGHIAKVVLLDTDAGANIRGSYFNFLVSGFKLFLTDNAKGLNATEVLESIKNEHSELFNAVGLFFSRHYAGCSWIKRAAVVGAMFATFEKSKKAAEEFWVPTVTGIGLNTKTDPRYRLREFMQEHGHHAALRGKENVSAEQAYRVCLFAWNHWRNNAAVQLLKRPDTSCERPKVKP